MKSEKKIYEMVLHAYQDVPLYRKLAMCKKFSIEDYKKEKCWENIPLLERDFAAQNANSILSDDCIPLLYSDGLIRSHTSGSTGIHMDVWWRKNDFRNSLLPLWLRRAKIGGIKPNDRVCIFNSFSDSPELFRYEKNSLFVSKSDLSESGLLKIYEVIAKFQPKWMLLQPSMAFLLCNITKKKKLPKIDSLVYIELTGEMCIPLGEKYIEECFSCTVKKHYGTMEVNTIGYETEKRNIYRIFPSSTFVEILNKQGGKVEKGEVGNIYVTSLHNYAMPIVRYGTGDRGKIFAEYKKGEKTLYLELMQARQNDFLLLGTGELIPPDILLSPIEYINEVNENAVLQFRVIQISQEELELHVVLDEEFSQIQFINVYIQQIRENFQEKFKYKFFFEEKITPCFGENKVKWFTNEFSKNA